MKPIRTALREAGLTDTFREFAAADRTTREVTDWLRAAFASQDVWIPSPRGIQNLRQSLDCAGRHGGRRAGCGGAKFLVVRNGRAHLQSAIEP